MQSQNWILSQMNTWQNKFAVIGLILILTMITPITSIVDYVMIEDAFFYDNLTYRTEVCIILFSTLFLVLALKNLLVMLFFSIIVFLITIVFPFFAPIAFIIILGLFLARIQFIIKNWKAIVVGFYIYSIAIVVTAFPEVFYFIPNTITTPLNAFFTVANANQAMILGSLSIIINFIYIGYYIVFAIIFQLLLNRLYKNQYTASTALNIASSIPLLIIALILPFLKIIGVDAVIDTTTDTVNATDPVQNGHINNADYHQVRGYIRHDADGSTEYVRPHLRTNPDGIIENNFSYKGEQHIIDNANKTAHIYQQETLIPNVIDTAYNNKPKNVFINNLATTNINLSIITLGLCFDFVLSIFYKILMSIIIGIII